MIIDDGQICFALLCFALFCFALLCFASDNICGRWVSWSLGHWVCGSVDLCCMLLVWDDALHLDAVLLFSGIFLRSGSFLMVMILVVFVVGGLVYLID
jgi:hypothetical protein